MLEEPERENGGEREEVLVTLEEAVEEVEEVGVAHASVPVGLSVKDKGAVGEVDAERVGVLLEEGVNVCRVAVAEAEAVVEGEGDEVLRGVADPDALGLLNAEAVAIGVLDALGLGVLDKLAREEVEKEGVLLELKVGGASLEGEGGLVPVPDTLCTPTVIEITPELVPIIEKDLTRL